MTTIASHLSVDALRERYVSSSETCEARHFQTIWLLAKGHSVGEVAELTSFGRRWIEQLAARYNAEGPGSLGDLRRRNGSTATVLKPELIEKLRVRLQEAPADGGLWTSLKVAAFLARELGVEKVAVQRGWEALKACGLSIQTPRPRNPNAASPEEEAAFKKSSRTPSPRKRQSTQSDRSRCLQPTSIGSD
jgi:transposase